MNKRFSQVIKNEKEIIGKSKITLTSIIFHLQEEFTDLQYFICIEDGVKTKQLVTDYDETEVKWTTQVHFFLEHFPTLNHQLTFGLNFFLECSDSENFRFTHRGKSWEYGNTSDGSS